MGEGTREEFSVKGGGSPGIKEEEERGKHGGMQYERQGVPSVWVVHTHTNTIDKSERVTRKADTIDYKFLTATKIKKTRHFYIYQSFVVVY